MFIANEGKKNLEAKANFIDRVEDVAVQLHLLDQ